MIGDPDIRCAYLSSIDEVGLLPTQYFLVDLHVNHPALFSRLVESIHQLPARKGGRWPNLDVEKQVGLLSKTDVISAGNASRSVLLTAEQHRILEAIINIYLERPDEVESLVWACMGLYGLEWFCCCSWYDLTVCHISPLPYDTDRAGCLG